VAVLERFGFRPAGIFPYFYFRHALVYQFVPDDCVDLGSIHCLTPEAGELLALQVSDQRSE
jgi:hypothetical protein